MLEIVESAPPEKIATEKPCGVCTFTSFVIDLNSVGVKDLPADDNGVWVTSPRRKYEVKRMDGKIISLRRVQNTSSNVVTICRQYGTHKATLEFRRIIATVINSKGVVLPRAIIQYFFVGVKKVPVSLPCHGNACQACRPFYRTQPNTLRKMKEECTKNPASVAYANVFEAASGIEGCRSASEEPRNKAQVYNAQKQCKKEDGCSKDEMFDLLELLKQHQSTDDGGFLREVTISSTPCAILASKTQLENVVKFCCQPSVFSILGVDATFKLGDFYVTLTTYWNLFLHNRHTMKPPVFLGPAFVHVERRFHDYQSFFATVLKLEPRLCDLQAYGTDGEMALVNTLETSFPKAIGLRCFIHKKKNIEDHLKGVPASSPHSQVGQELHKVSN